MARWGDGIAECGAAGVGRWSGGQEEWWVEESWVWRRAGWPGLSLPQVPPLSEVTQHGFLLIPHSPIPAHSLVILSCSFLTSSFLSIPHCPIPARSLVMHPCSFPSNSFLLIPQSAVSQMQEKKNNKEPSYFNPTLFPRILHISTWMWIDLSFSSSFFLPFLLSKMSICQSKFWEITKAPISKVSVPWKLDNRHMEGEINLIMITQ